ncbi:kinase-like domain-containing protein, partial [Dichotomocladium elegans]
LLNTFIGKQSIQLISLLGVGAYGVVYLGVHVPTSRRYAVKLLTRSCAIETEIELHSRVCCHPGILPIHCVIREKSRVFLVLEYASGGDLFRAITKSEGIMGNNRAVRHIFLQIIDAVQHCHDQGIAHRDLKPENILVFPHLKVKLADFGLATKKLVSGELNCGSSFYFSPECQGHLTNHRGYSTRQNDIWSLGVILVNLAAGRNPWRRASVEDPAFQQYIKNPCPSFFKTLLPMISDELSILLTRIFCLDPARRISLPVLRVHVSSLKVFANS